MGKSGGKPQRRELRQENIPDEILDPLLEGRFQWSRKEWLLTQRVMDATINPPLDDFRAWRDATKEFEEWINE